MKTIFLLSLFACNQKEKATTSTSNSNKANEELKKGEKKTAPEQKNISKTTVKSSEAPKPADIWVQEVGLSTPESVLYDAKKDRYLVSNINGNPTAADDNGFISVLSTDGKVENLKWIDGASDKIELNAPKGMAILDDKLYVSDIKSVRVFDLHTGVQKTSIAIKGASFLNDVVSDGQVVYISDSGMNPDFSASGTDAIYRIYKEGKHEKVVADKSFSKPNGLAIHNSNIYMVNFGGAEMRILNPKGETTKTHSFPKGSLDGIELRSDGSAFVSSWESSSVYLRKTDGAIETVVSNVDAPADIGWDAKRNRLLVPLFKQNKVLIKTVAAHSQ